MKKKLIFAVFFSFIIVGFMYSITMRQIKSARYMLEGAKADSKAILENFFEMSKTFPLGKLPEHLEKFTQDVDVLEETAISSALEKMPVDTRISYENHKMNAEKIKLELVVRYKAKINRVFLLLENILENTEKETGQYKKELAKTNKKIAKLAKEIRRLQEEIKTLRNNPDLKNIYAKMEKDSKSLLQELHELGKEMTEEASKELEDLLESTNFITTAIKENTDPKIMKNFLAAQSNRNQAFKNLLDKIDQLPPADARILRGIILMLNTVRLTLNTLEYGPKQIEKWDLKKVLSTDKPWEKKKKKEEEDKSTKKSPL